MRMKSVLLWLFVFLLSAAFPGPSPEAAVEWREAGSLNIGAEPLDVAVSADGKWTFVLTGKGEVMVFSSDGRLNGRVPVGKAVKKIGVSSTGNRLFLLSGSEQALRSVSLDFIQDIRTEGSPFKGPADAPVVIAVFSDFQ